MYFICLIFGLAGEQITCTRHVDGVRVLVKLVRQKTS
uniref:Uncharacterized protein n=1 Tax=Anguilla anguilla TaxID=7936 RepID=A0A0E9SW84_ANGAN